jgi:hypothetical protein
MRHQAVEHIALIANLCVVRVGERTKRVRLRPIVTVGADKLAGAARERPQEQLVDDAEDRGVGTNANGENEDGQEGKSWRLDKGAERRRRRPARVVSSVGITGALGRLFRYLPAK